MGVLQSRRAGGHCTEAVALLAEAAPSGAMHRRHTQRCLQPPPSPARRTCMLPSQIRSTAQRRMRSRLACTSSSSSDRLAISCGNTGVGGEVKYYNTLTPHDE